MKRNLVTALLDFDCDAYVKRLQEEIITVSMALRANIPGPGFIYNFETGVIDEVKVVDNGPTLDWLLKEYNGYGKDNYPEIFA